MSEQKSKEETQTDVNASSSSAQLADRLRQSIRSQRPTSPNANSKPNQSKPAITSRTTLEERLKSSFTIGDVSAATTPSQKGSPPPQSGPSTEHPLSPTSVPLPQSPETSYTPETPLPASSEIAGAIPSLSQNDSKPNGDALPAEDPLNGIHLDPPTGLPGNTPEGEKGRQTDVEALQERLKLVEHRFTEVSQSFKRLQAERLAAEVVLKELTPLESINDKEALGDYLRNSKQKLEISKDEIRSLNTKLQTQDGRIQELRDTHRLESLSQSEQIDRLRKQLEESEALLKSSTGSASKAEAVVEGKNAEISRLQKEVDKSAQTVKEEEEKRVKAVTLLKTVRQKLVKAEKDKEEAVKELDAIKGREAAERQMEAGERAKLQKEIEEVNSERERALGGLKEQFEKEVAGLKDRFERELSTTKGQLELDAVTARNAHDKELSFKNARISSLDELLSSVTRDKNSYFEQLQQRQAELESSQMHLSTLQGQNTELQFQLREATDKIGMLSEHLSELRLNMDDARSPSQLAGSASEDIAGLIASTESKYEIKLAELTRHLNVAERERSESEAQWSRKLREKGREADDLRRALGSVGKTRERDEEVVGDLRRETDSLREERSRLDKENVLLREQIDKLVDSQNTVKSFESEHAAKVSVLEQQLTEAKQHESQLRTTNKTLRDELRKVQSSAALLEKQRNPGVGYWISRENGSSNPRSSTSSLPDSGATSPSPSVDSKNEEEVNLEYLRNVILQFLEHKEMRPNLVKVLSTILHFTPQETRRLIAKV